MDPSPVPAPEVLAAAEPLDASGPVLFARYAFPPNELGYCGPDGAWVLLEHATSDGAAHEIADRARAFDGAWPYLEVIAGVCGIEDPLDARVVEAYWVGNDLLERVDPAEFLAILGRKFAGQVGGIWDRVDPASGPLAHHSFHVLAVYPWFGLLDSGSDVPLSVLEQCRIRWGTVVEVVDEHAVVRSRPLAWDGQRLSLGAEREESVRWSSGGRSLRAGLEPGDFVSLHWDWVCDRLSEPQVAALSRLTASQLDLVSRHSR